MSKEEVARLLALAEAADNEKIPNGMNLPEEIARREEGLRAIAVARDKIEARAAERFEQENAEYQAKVAKREAKASETGKKPKGKAPTAPIEGPRDNDQINLTDEESRIMKTAGGLRAEPQRTDRGRYGKHADRQDRHGAGEQRQATGSTHVEATDGLAK